MNRTISENLSNTKNRDINIPLSPASFSKRTDGKWEYICGNCSYRFEEAPRCPECGQLLKSNTIRSCGNTSTILYSPKSVSPQKSKTENSI